MNNNETQQQMNTPNPNLQMNYPPGQPVPVAYQAPPVIYQTPQPPPQQNVIVIQEESKSQAHSDNCCYCRAPRKSACGCLEPNQYYCCFLIVGNYVLLGLQYVMTCLCIVRLCQVICWWKKIKCLIILQFLKNNKSNLTFIKENLIYINN